jgi:hypothetical protein
MMISFANLELMLEVDGETWTDPPLRALASNSR